MRKFKTKVITDESQVPAGFRRISALADSLSDQKKLSDAHTDGIIAAVKLMRSADDRTGPVWVDAEAAKRVLEGTSSQSRRQASLQFRVNGAPAEQYEAAVVALCEINNGITLMQVTLERLTTAVESIATQPKTPHQESMATIGGNGSWRDMNGEAH